MKEVLKSTNHIYIVMEIITGGELFDKIVAAKKFDEDTARKYFRQLIDGVSYCHQNNIAHRDLVCVLWLWLLLLLFSNHE